MESLLSLVGHLMLNRSSPQSALDAIPTLVKEKETENAKKESTDAKKDGKEDEDKARETEAAAKSEEDKRTEEKEAELATKAIITLVREKLHEETRSNLSSTSTERQKAGGEQRDASSEA